MTWSLSPYLIHKHKRRIIFSQTQLLLLSYSLYLSTSILCIFSLSLSIFAFNFLSHIFSLTGNGSIFRTSLSLSIFLSLSLLLSLSLSHTLFAIVALSHFSFCLSLLCCESLSQLAWSLTSKELFSIFSDLLRDSTRIKISDRPTGRRWSNFRLSCHCRRHATLRDSGTSLLLFEEAKKQTKN